VDTTVTVDVNAVATTVHEALGRIHPNVIAY
jgi:hypothetical protein